MPPSEASPGLLGRPLPDLTLPDSNGDRYPLRQFVGRRPLALFFYILNGSPGWIRELREFRGAYEDYRRAGVELAGLNSDSIAGNAAWTRRLRLPYPLLSDRERVAADALGGLMRFGIGGWTIDLFRRRTVLAGRDGIVAAIWDRVRIRGHAAEVLRAAQALERADG